MDEESVPDVCSIEKINSKVKKKKTIQNNLILFDVGNISSKCKKNVRTKKKIEKISKKSDNCLAENENLITNFENPERAETPNSEDYKLDCSEYKIVEKFVKKILKKKHDHNEARETTIPIFDENDSENINDTKAKCKVCFKIFEDVGVLQKHIDFAHSEEKPHKCCLCNSSFKNDFSLKAHKKIHTEDDLYECEFCSKKFVHKSKLAIHLRTHINIRPFECDVCNKKFKTNGNLTYHMQIHNEKRSYECETCGKLFRQSLHLANHIRIHTDERPFACEICKMAFNQSHVLVTHKWRAHNINEPKKKI